VLTDRDIARWRLHSQHLAAPVDGAEHAVRSLLAVQAENQSQSAWAVATRTTNRHQADLADLLAGGRVLRTHVLRPTWHYVHADDALWLIELTRARVLPTVDQQLVSLADRMNLLTDAVVAILAETPDRTRAELADSIAQRGHELTGMQLMLLAAHLELHALICSGVPRGSEHTYALFADRVDSSRRLEREEALVELALRYFTSHGPATARDLAYWATLTLTDVRQGLAGAADRLESFEHVDRTYWHAPGGPPTSASPKAHLLQVLDEMYRGYQDSRWALDADGLLSRGRETAIGMALVDGQVVAGMKRAIAARTVTFELRRLRPVEPEEEAAIQDAAARYARYLGLEPRLLWTDSAD
jgi:hypothetical protein